MVEERPNRYLVVLDRDQVIGEFTEEEDARLFAYICAIHGDKGDVFETYKSIEGFEVAE